MNRNRAAWAVAAVFGASAITAAAHDENTSRTGKPEKLGNVNFPVSCTAEAQKEFNRGMAQFHSFWHDPAQETFKKVLALDPQCGMAYWGISIMAMGNPFGWGLSPASTKAGAPAAADAQRVGAKTERERDYIAALGVYFKDWETTDFRTRAVAFEKAMETVAAKYPDDDEAKIVYALALNITAQATDKTFVNQRKAAALLEPLYRKYPNHPGITHYLIHTYDYAELSQQGLPYARVYSDIAPSVPHALHMPSHIYSRLGLWKEMIESNRAAHAAAREELQGGTLGLGATEALHTMDYLVFGLLQQSQDAAAKRYVDEARTVNAKIENFAAAYALAAIPARYALERGRWDEAAKLNLSSSAMPWEKFPHAESILVFARGLGAARSGDVPSARKDAERLQALKDAMIAAKIGYWPGQTDFQLTTVNAWIAFAEKRSDEALKLMRAAADAEEASDKHPVTPGNVVPSRELLADMLMMSKQPALAFAEFERSLKRDPNRLRSLYGAARAADASGNKQAARDYNAKVQQMTATRDTQRPELSLAMPDLRAAKE